MREVRSPSPKRTPTGWSIPGYVEDKKGGGFVPTLIEVGGREAPNPEAIRLLRRESKLRRLLETWAASFEEAVRMLGFTQNCKVTRVRSQQECCNASR